HHLFVSNELTYFRLASYHNVYFFLKLMEEIREAIKGGYSSAFSSNIPKASCRTRMGLLTDSNQNKNKIKF
ncbi:MAG: hypothetical protein QXM45_03975, partial [Archaeoglobaceae archaeon]